MKLRLAKKILDAVGTDRETAYTEGQVNRALRRTERTGGFKEDTAYWEYLMAEMREEKKRAEGD